MHHPGYLPSDLLGSSSESSYGEDDDDDSLLKVYSAASTQSMRRRTRREARHLRRLRRLDRLRLLCKRPLLNDRAPIYERPPPSERPRRRLPLAPTLPPSFVPGSPMRTLGTVVGIPVARAYATNGADQELKVSPLHGVSFPAVAAATGPGQPEPPHIFHQLGTPPLPVGTPITGGSVGQTTTTVGIPIRGPPLGQPAACYEPRLWHPPQFHQPPPAPPVGLPVRGPPSQGVLKCPMEANSDRCAAPPSTESKKEAGTSLPLKSKRKKKEKDIPTITNAMLKALAPRVEEAPTPDPRSRDEPPGLIELAAFKLLRIILSPFSKWFDVNLKLKRHMMESPLGIQDLFRPQAVRYVAPIPEIPRRRRLRVPSAHDQEEEEEKNETAAAMLTEVFTEPASTASEAETPQHAQARSTDSERPAGYALEKNEVHICEAACAPLNERLACLSLAAVWVVPEFSFVAREVRESAESAVFGAEFKVRSSAGGGAGTSVYRLAWRLKCSAAARGSEDVALKVVCVEAKRRSAGGVWRAVRPGQLGRTWVSVSVCDRFGEPLAPEASVAHMFGPAVENKAFAFPHFLIARAPTDNPLAALTRAGGTGHSLVLRLHIKALCHRQPP